MNNTQLKSEMLKGLAKGESMRSIGISIAKKIPGNKGEFIGDFLCRVSSDIGATFIVSGNKKGMLEMTGLKCPFGDTVKGFPALCNMTKQVFVRLASLTHPSATVHLNETKAQGGDVCRVTFYAQSIPKVGFKDDLIDPEYTQQS